MALRHLQYPGHEYTMRAPFNTTCTLLDGPATGTPGFPRVVDAPCRLVPDPEFRTVEVPEHAALVYLTLDAGVPLGPQITDLGGGVYQSDYGFSDRVTIAAIPGVTWIAVRVELCTPPAPAAAYFRVHLTPDLGTLSACQTTYADSYIISITGGRNLATLFRVAPTTWVGGGWTLYAETAPIVPGMCTYTWTLTKDLCTWSFAYDGTGSVNALPFPLSCGNRTITAN